MVEWAGASCGLRSGRRWDSEAHSAEDDGGGDVDHRSARGVVGALAHGASAVVADGSRADRQRAAGTRSLALARDEVAAGVVLVPDPAAVGPVGNWAFSAAGRGSRKENTVVA